MNIKRERGYCEFKGCSCPLFHARKRSTSILQCTLCEHGAVWHCWKDNEIRGNNTLATNAKVDVPSEDVDVPSEEVSHIEESQIKLDNEQDTKDTGMVSQKISIKDENQTLQEENSVLKERFRCIICLENECNCVLTACGHAAFCENCIKNVTKCPLCRKDIIGKTTFIPL
jgi:hypothetical protein